jgi:sirohydrochlorin ferrochelatase
MAFITLVAAPSISAQTGLLVVAHGANAGWNARVRETVAQVRWQGPVATAFLMGEEADTAGWGPALERLVQSGAKSAVVVPLMISSAGGHYYQVQFYAGEIAEMPKELTAHQHAHPPASPIHLTVTRAIDDAPELGQILADLRASLPPADQQRATVLVAHGPNSEAEATVWIRNLNQAAQGMFSGKPRPFGIGLLKDDAPPPVRAAAVQDLRETISRLARETSDSVTVIPVLISTGFINTSKIPRDLEGLPIRYVPVALAPSAHLARWIERVATESLERRSATSNGSDH